MNERSTIFSPCRKYRYTLWRQFGQSPICSYCGQGGEMRQDSRNSKVCDSCFEKWRFLGDDAEKNYADWKRIPPPPYVQFIGLNPSTADETKNDPTIRRCIDFAQRWGYGALCMTNLFAWRDTLPANMKKASEPIGEDNDQWLLDVAKGAGIVVAAWGNHGTHLYRAAKVKALLKENGVKLHYFRLTKAQQPEHPLYMPAETVPKPFEHEMEMARGDVERFREEVKE